MFSSAGSKSAQRRRFVANSGLVSNSSGVFSQGSIVYILDSIANSFNGVLTTFNLAINTIAITPSSPQNLIVHLGGVYQTPVSSYAITGSTITFASPPATNETCSIVWLSSTGSPPVVIANSGLVSNNAGIFVNANTGIIANSTGTFQDFTYRPPYENLLINGSMDVWARFFPGFAVVNTTPATVSGAVVVSGNGYTSDMWQVVPTGASVNASANTGRLLSAYSLQVNGATSVTALTIKQRIEGLDSIRTSNQQVTLQAQIWNGTTGTITPQLTIKYPTALDNYTSTSTLINANNLQSCPNSQWTQVAFSFVSNTTAQFGMEVSFVFGALNTTSQIIRITECDMQITPGFANGLISNPPVLWNRKFTEELNLCRRHAYFGGTGWGGEFVNSSYITMQAIFPIQMRAVPTNIIVTTPHIQVPGASDKTGSTTTIAADVTTLGGRMDMSGFSGASAGNYGILHTTDCLLFHCEL